ncbi:MAG TPA: energy transducer TonB [Verrucomicrobiae bacterium]|nr:energy transducer TonB [Verrucomicrobiae bacterium]
MVPQTQPRKPRNSSKINLIISLAFHGVLVFFVLYFAARSGVLGKTAQNLVIVKVKTEPPKPKEVEKKKEEEPPKDEPKIQPTEPPKMTATHTVTAPPTGDAPAAPAAVEVPSFVFGGGTVVNDADPVTIYKSLLQSSLTARWKRPDMGDKDKDYVAEVQVNIDPSGHISNPVMVKASGNKTWDDSVSQAIAETKQMSKSPPKGFPNKVTVKFDIAEEKADSLFQ